MGTVQLTRIWFVGTAKWPNSFSTKHVFADQNGYYRRTRSELRTSKIGLSVQIVSPNSYRLTPFAMAAISSWRYRSPMSFAKLDHWIGKTLFVPLIIKICQMTHQSQYAVARLFWFIAALDGFYRADTLIASILWGGVSILMMVSAVRRADMPTVSFMYFRLLTVLFLASDLIKGVVTGEWAGIEFWVLVLVAEYASIIRTIPPKEATKRADNVAEAR